ncbi:hypothetical protein LCGC14_2995210 [marine sediment metagenome]|uniref:Uncharacterized protein n=1 Tax=marine sediment metagenome TaxID=412755 RepID=A0A0F8X2P7_9ZZZZ
MRVKFQENKPVPEGFYLARVDGLEETVHPQYGKSIKWTFTIIEAPSCPEAVNTTVTAMSSMKVSPKSKLFSWLQAFGVILGADDDFEMDSLLGKMVKVQIKNNTKVAVVDGQERSTTYSNVCALAAYVPQVQQAAPAQAQAAAPAQAQAAAPAQAQAAAPAQAQAAPTANTVPQQNLVSDEEFDF